MGRRSVALLLGNAGSQRTKIKRTLARLGCSVKSVQPNSDILCAVKALKPDMILLGPVRGKPGRGGLCRLLKHDPQARYIPVLALLDSRSAPDQWNQVALADEVLRESATAQEIAWRVRTLLRLKRLTHETRRALRLLDEQSRIDDLTGLATHGAFKERLEREFQRAARYRRLLSLLMVDVDYFKHYNDHFGHPAGDRLLRRVGRMVAGELRRVDFGARYGGDEFSVILPETPKAAAAVVAERIRRSIERHPFLHSASQPLGRVTVSVGVATYPEDAAAGVKLVEAADRALYRAKTDGRNRVWGAQGAPSFGAATAP